jgi:hypothetical protein
MRAGGNDLVVRSEMRVAAEPADAPIMSRTRGVALRLIRVRAR